MVPRSQRKLYDNQPTETPQVRLYMDWFSSPAYTFSLLSRVTSTTEPKQGYSYRSSTPYIHLHYYFAYLTNKPKYHQLQNLNRVTSTGEVVGMVANLKLIVEHGSFTTFMIVVSDSVSTSVKT